MDDKKTNPRSDSLGPRKVAKHAAPAKSTTHMGDDEWQDAQVAPQNGVALPSLSARSKGGSWFKQNPAATAVIAGGILVVLLLLLAFQFGLFGGSSPETPPAVASSTPTTTPASSAAPPPQQPAKTSSEPVPKAAAPANDDAAKSDAATKEQADKDAEANLPLPPDVSLWNGTHYSRARRNNDPRLLLAIARLAEKYRGRADTAQALVELLKPLPPDVYKRATDAAGQPDQGPPAVGKYGGDAGPPAVGKYGGEEGPPAVGKYGGDAGPPAVGKYGGEEGAPGVGKYGGPQAEGLAAPGAFDPAAAASQAPAGPPTQADLTRLVEAIIAALGEIGTPVSNQTFEKILGGEFATDDDKTAVDAVLKVLATHPSPENETLLLRTIVAPDALRPAERQGPWTAKDLRSRAFEFVKLSTSGELRAKLADALADRLLRLVAGDPIREFFLAADPLNCGAQLVLYQKSDPNKETKAKLEQQLTAYSASLLTQLLKLPNDASATAVTSGLAGFSAEGGYGGGVGKGGVGKFGGDDMAPPQPAFNPVPANIPGLAVPGNVDVGRAAYLAGILWADKFHDLLHAELGRLPSLEKQAQLFVLASTIPLDPTRAALAKALKKRWNDGPKALEAAGLSETMTTDPGLLVILKGNPRRQSRENRVSSAGVSPRFGRAGKSAPTGGRTTEGGAMNAAQKKDQAEQDWMALSTKLVDGWCKRLQSAALAKEKAAADLGATLTADAKPKLPGDLTLPEGAKVLAACHIVLPGDAPAEFGEQKPGRLEVYYLKIEESNKARKAMGFYTRQLGPFKPTETRTTEKAIWLDTVRMVPQTDQRRSIDVIISRADNQAGDILKDADVADLTVEILTVQIKDPRE